jgi:hypothetical protein
MERCHKAFFELQAASCKLQVLGWGIQQECHLLNALIFIMLKIKGELGLFAAGQFGQ